MHPPLAVAGHWGAGNTATLIGVVIAVIWYFVPAIVAFRFDRQHKIAIAVTNLFTAWTILGWIGTFAWSLFGRSHEH